MAVLDRRFLVCLTVLVLNDRVLKPEFGNWITGKLSDVVGVVVFAVVLAELLRLVGIDRQRSAPAGVWLCAASLLAVKLHAGAAAGVVSMFESLGISYDIVVDPTDTLALLALPLALRILDDPKPIANNRTTGRIVFAFACLACAASGQDATAGYDWVEQSETGTVVVGRSEGFESTVKMIGVLDRGEWKVRVEESNGGVSWTKTTESCSPVDPLVCLRVGSDAFNPSRVDVSTDGGDTFRSGWVVDDAASWFPSSDNTVPVGRPSFYEATDIEWTDDGRGVIAMSDRFPIVRQVDGSFSPSIGDLHPFPWFTFGAMAGAWLFLSLALRMVGQRERTRGLGVIAVGVGCFVGGGILFSEFEGFGALPAVVGALPAGVLFLVIGYGLFLTDKNENTKYIFSPVSLVDVVGPLVLLAALAFLWDIDWLGWYSMLTLMIATIGAAAYFAWPLERRPGPLSEPTVDAA